MIKVKFTECDDDQARFGRGADPRKFLELGKEYILMDKEIHSWHTLYYLEGFDPGFNSVCFEDVDSGGMNEEKLKHLEGATRDLVSSLLFYDRKEDEDLSREDIDELREKYPDLNEKITAWFVDELND